MKVYSSAILFALLVGACNAAWQDCPNTCRNIKNKRPCRKQSTNGCCVFNNKRKKCVDWPSCNALKQKDCKRDPSCIWSWKGNSNSWATDSNVQSSVGGCMDKPAGFNKAECEYNTQRGCKRLDYCKWRVNQNRKGGKCITNGNPTGSPTTPTSSPTKAPTTGKPTSSPTAGPTPAYTGSYTPYLDETILTSGSALKCRNNFQVQGQSLAQRANCESNCNSCSSCIGYNWIVESIDSAGVATYKCVYKQGGTRTSAPGDAYYEK